MIHVLKYTITITIIIIIVRAVILEPDFVPRCSQHVVKIVKGKKETKRTNRKKRDRRFSFFFFLNKMSVVRKETTHAQGNGKKVFESVHRAHPVY